MAKKTRFNLTNLDAIQPPAEGRIEVRDTVVPYLACRVTAGGHKSFAVVTWSQGKAQRVTLGTYKVNGDKRPRMTPEQARKLAEETKARMNAGVDVAAEKRKEKVSTLTLREALEQYILHRQRVKDMKPRTAKDYGEVVGEAAEKFLDRPLLDMRDHFNDLYLARGERSPARANNFARVIRAVWNFHALQNDKDEPIFGQNPVNRALGKDGWFTVKRRRTRLKDSDFGPWLAAVRSIKSTRSTGGAEAVRGLLLTLLFTGARLSEAMNLQWPDVDLENRLLTFTDTKNRDDHVLPIPDILLPIFEERREAAKGAAVFWNWKNPDRPVSGATLRQWIEAIATDAGVRVTPHDLRRSFASVAAGDKVKVSGFLLARILNHRTALKQITASYTIHDDPEELREPMNRTARRILELEAGS